MTKTKTLPSIIRYGNACFDRSRFIVLKQLDRPTPGGFTHLLHLQGVGQTIELWLTPSNADTILKQLTGKSLVRPKGPDWDDYVED